MLLHDLERALEELPLAGVPLDLAARRLGDAVGPHHHQRLEGHFVFDRQPLANLVEGRREFIGLALAAFELGHDDDPLAVVHVDGERRHGARPHERARLLDRPLDVLRIMVAAADDDQVLEPAGHEQFAGVEKPEVARAQIRPGIRLPLLGRLCLRMRIGTGEHRCERLAGGVVAVPVALRHARPAHPDLADPARRQRLARLWIDDPHVLAVELAARAHEPAGPGREARAGGRRTRLERRRVE